MAKPKQTSLKADREKKKKRKQQEKEEKREQRKATSNKGKGFDSMIAYIDHNGHISSTPPDPKLKVEINPEDILIGARSFIRERETETKSGRIAIFNSDKNYGFIKDGLSQQKIFFHISATNFAVKEGDTVSYEVAKGAKGFHAVNVIKK
ncbi:MAG: cold shock domain-containing protein [Sediminibacterium sp.]|nr:cold shock domain-containing protein [Sediminibacterium sp.]